MDIENTGVKVVDENGRAIAILENAYDIGYSAEANQLWRAWFAMPADDPKLKYCEPLAYIEIWEEGSRVELFRIMPSALRKSEIIEVKFECEHVAATLIDDIMFRYHEIGGTGIYTPAVINYILNRQSETRWVLGECDFNRQFSYKWENENLLGSLFSIPNRFLEPYIWRYNTTVYPWKISLKQIEQTTRSYIRYRKNLTGIEKVVDPSQLCTRLYCLGYGEGDNQLDIAAVNNGLPYLQATTVSKYGVVARTFVDRRFEDAQSLKERGQAILNELQTPYISYEIGAVDLSPFTEDPLDKFQEGTYTQIHDEEIDENIKAMVLSLQKDKIDATPEIEIVIANKPMDVARSIADLADRQRINEVYSQGATNLDSKDFSDNCDTSNPAVIEFYIPEETVRINKMIMNMRTEPFRAYSKAVKGGGVTGLTSGEGGGISFTTTDGGVNGLTAEEGKADISTSSDGGGTIVTGDTVTIGSSSVQTEDDTTNTGKHNHGISSGTKLATVDNNGAVNGSVGWVPSGAHQHGEHEHDFELPNHKHTITQKDHKHGFNLPDHGHTIEQDPHDHNFTLPDHEHDIEYGIFQAFELPTAVLLKIDNNTVPGSALQRNDLNIVSYLAKDSGGKITRGWHTITASPNALARIVISLTSQIYVQSRGTGDF